jgi:hypothetical protein
MRSCRSRLPRICEAWIRIRESSFFGTTSAVQCSCNFPKQEISGEQNNFPDDLSRDFLARVIVARVAAVWSGTPQDNN